MSAAALSASPSRRRVWLFVVVVVFAQVGLTFWLGDKTRVKPRPAAAEPQVLLAPHQASEVSALNDPTLFVWANPGGFSGAAWLRVLPLKYSAADWTEPPRFLQLQVAQLGNIFQHLVRSNATMFEIASKREIPVTTPLVTLTTSIPTRSTMRIEGDLAGRRLLSQFDLPSVPANDTLPDTVVQVMVNAGGWAESTTLLSSSGSKEADTKALDMAKSVEWEPLRDRRGERTANHASALSWGQLVFSWHTVPLAATNVPAILP